ncbi:hypothetical protein MMC11_005662 [Xylographa trunciseda]|nr:hypothetical protein [Xylographa trunciseda]
MELSHASSIEQMSKSTQASDRLQGCISVYGQLPVNELRTRILMLHSPSSNVAAVSCSLEVMTLHPEPKRPYTALSYVWGDPSITEDVIVNGVSFAVTSNLVSALRQIQKGFGDVHLWADAICVNQKDVQERSQQVLLMKNIYSKAERVIGWLGPDDNGGSQALRTLETLLSNTIRYPDNFAWFRKMPELLTLNGTYPMDNGKTFESNDRIENLLLLLRRPFWRRIWIVQELVLPLNLRLLCGEEFTDIPEPDSFHNTVDKLSRISNGRPKFLPLGLWMRVNECFAVLRLLAALRHQHLHQEDQANRIWQGISGFLHARPLLEFHKTSDPRDHVYGLLGLIDLDIVPDYGEDVTVADVYLEVARHCLKAEPLDILCFAGTTHSYNGPDCLTHLDPPSWVPDWRLPPPARVRLHRYPQSHAFPSNGGLQMQVIDHNWLRGSAVVWDTVSRTEHKTGWDLTEWDLVEKIDIEKPGDRAYPSGISRFKAIIILWLGGYDGSKTSRCDLQLNSELFRSYEIILFANIAKPWANKHGRHEIPKLVDCMFGQNRFTAVPDVPNGHRESYVARSRQLRYNMRCFHTERGYIGLGPLATEVGDLVCILEGHKAPVLLRRRGSHYIFVSDCDVVGIMNGEVLEAVKLGEAAITEIEIR